MDFFETTAGVFIVQFGSGLCLLLAMMEYVKYTTHAKFDMLFYTALCLFSVQSRVGFYLDGNLAEHLYLVVLFVPSIFAMGPVLDLLAQGMLDRPPKSLGTYGVHFIPAAIAFLGESYFVFLDPETTRQMIATARTELTYNIVDIAMIAGSSHVLMYFSLLVYRYLTARTEYDLRYTHLVYAILFIPVVGIICILIGYIIKVLLLVGIGAGLVSITATFFYLFTAKYPDFFTNIKNDIKTYKYANTQLTGVNMTAVHDKLRELMEEEKIYRDDGLRLQGLADELLITPHQLSRIINESYQKNFNEFINGYRVAEAQELLVSQPDWTVLRVALDVGFSNKSTFNEHFQRVVKLSPVKYRQSKLKA